LQRTPRAIGALFFGVQMNQPSTSTTASTNGESTAHDLFALTDEQILEIEPETQDASVVRDPWPLIREEKPSGQAQGGSEPLSNGPRNRLSGEKPNFASQSSTNSSPTDHGTRDTEHAPQEPPPWLAAQMKDPWTGQEARELWNGVQQAKSEAAAYRAAFATPEDARALKELYPGGVNEARAAAERAHVLDDIDRAYFGAVGKSAQEVSASREQLAQRMLREDPAAFREMVFAGLRALEELGKVPGDHTVARAFKPEGVSSSAAPATLASPGGNGGAAAGGGASPSRQASPAPTAPSVVGAQPAAAGAPAGNASPNEAHVAAYAAFEKAANEDLERSVGASIDRTLAQALPNASRVSNASGIGARHASSVLEARPAPLQARLSQAIRQDVEAALKGDRQLGEQVAQILSGRRLDEETRGQVVRLIGERAEQLVPIAAKRVLNDWTQTTLAVHRSGSARADAASARREVAPASLPAGPSAGPNRARSQDQNRGAVRSDARRVDYRKLSDEQILDL
jgi:hypothetical protein